MDEKVGTKISHFHSRNGKAIVVNPVVSRSDTPRQIQSKVPPTFATDVGPILTPVGTDTVGAQEER